MFGIYIPKGSWGKIEIIIIDNDSVENKTKEFLKDFQKIQV